jgi:polyisoprenoid-binding protein YceI
MEAMSIPTRTPLPTGTWQVDPAHSRIGFAVKHLGIATARGAFTEFEGTLDLDEGRAHGTVQAASVDTESTEIRPLGEDTFEIEGDLEILGVTKPIVLRAELQGPETDSWGAGRIALEVTGELDRSDWGMTNPLLAGIMRVSSRVKLQLDIAAVRQA